MVDRTLVTGFTWFAPQGGGLPGGRRPHQEEVGEGVRLHGWVGDPPALGHKDLVGTLAFRIAPGRACTGWHDGQVRRPCPDRATGGRTCDECGRRDAFRPCMTCDGFRCPRLGPEMLAYCRQTHHLYLACFGDREIKVGTASDGRREQRIVEQGPLAAARVASGEGPTIKQMEHLLAEAGFSETMRRARKTVLLQGAMSEQTAEGLVLGAAQELRDVLPADYHRTLHPPELVPQPDVARRSRRLTVNELRVEDDRVVEGTVVGAVGHLVFVEDRDGRFALDVGELKGRVLEWNPTGPRRKAQAQLGLF